MTRQPDLTSRSKTATPASVNIAAANRSILALHNVGEIRAQQAAVDMIELLQGLALDVCISKDELAVLEFRRKCALDVLDRAMGKPLNRNLTIMNTPEAAGANKDVQKTLEAAQQSAALLQMADQYVGRGVPYEEWPEEVKAFVSGGAAYSIIEDSGPAPPDEAPAAAAE
jgi:hypothetical protein